MAFADSLLGQLLSTSSEEGLSSLQRITARREAEKEKFIIDPTHAEKILSHLSRQFVPEKKVAKIGVNAPLAKIEEAIPQEDPRRLAGSATLQEFQQVLPYAPSHVEPTKLLGAIYKKNLQQVAEPTYRAIREQESSWFGTGIGGKKLVPMPGYEEWKQKETQSRLARPTEWTHPAEGAAWGLGAYTAATVAAGVAATAAGIAAAPIAIPTLLAGAAAATILGSVEMGALDVARNVINRSDWAQERPGKAVLAEMGLGVLGAAGIRKAAPGLVKLSLNYESAKNAVLNNPSAENLLNVVKAKSVQEQQLDLFTGKGMSALSNVLVKIKPGQAIAPEQRTRLMDIFGEQVTKGVSLEDATKLAQEQLRREEGIKLTSGLKGILEQKAKTDTMLGELKKTRALGEIQKRILAGESLEEVVPKVNQEVEALARHYDPHQLDLPGMGFNIVPETKEAIQITKIRAFTAKSQEIISKKLLAKGFSYTPEEVAGVDKGLRKSLMKLDISEGIKKAQDDIVNHLMESPLLKEPWRKPPSWLKAEELTKPIIKPTLVGKELSGIGNLTAENIQRRLVAGDNTIVADLQQQLVSEKVNLADAHSLIKHIPTRAEAVIRGQFPKGPERTAALEDLRVNLKSIMPKVEGMLEGEKVRVIGGVTKPQEVSLKINKTIPPTKTGVKFLGERNPKTGTLLVTTPGGKSVPFKSELHEVVYSESFDKRVEVIPELLGNPTKFGESLKSFSEAEISQVQATAKVCLIVPTYGNIGKVKAVPKIIPVLGMAAMMIPVMDFLSPSEVTAAGPMDIATKVPALVAKGMESLYKNKGEMFNAMKKAQLLLTPIAKDAPFTLPQAQKSISVIPNYEAITRFKRLPFNLGRILSPSTQGQLFYGAKEGIEGFTNPVVELASRTNTALNNASIGMEVFANITKTAGIKSEVESVRAAMKPLANQYAEDFAVAGHHFGWINSLEEKSVKALKSIKKGLSKEEEDDILSGLDNIQKELQFHKDELAKRKPILDQLQQNWETTAKGLAAKHSGTRVALAVEDTAEFTKYPWLKSILTKDELVATARIKSMMDEYALRMIDSGLDPILSEPYVHHAPHPDVAYKTITKSLEAAGITSDDALRLAEFHSRSLGSKQMMPDIHYIMEHYLPDANRRIEIADFWKKGQNGGWYAHMNSAVVQQNDGLRNFWERLNKGFDPIEKGGVNRWSKYYYAFETARLLALSPSVGIKHLIKMEANWSNFGIKESVQLLPVTFKTALRGAISEVRKNKELPATMEETAYKSFVNQRSLYRTISDMDLYDMSSSKWERYLDKFNQKGSFFVDSAERFDRAHSFVAATTMAAKQGMTPSQAAYAVMDTILKTNFLSGNMNPAWLKDPKVRMLFMFQGTPFKMLEQRVVQAMRAGGNVADAAKETYGMVKNLRKDIKDGEYIFKTNVIKDCLTKDKDLFGTPVTQQMMRKMLILGTIVGTGKYGFDADLWDNVAHVPFIKVEGGEVAVRTNPFIQSALESYSKKTTDGEDFWFQDFFKSWLKEGLVQQTLIKAARISRDDIPERYRDSRIKYVFGIPAVKKEE